MNDRILSGISNNKKRCIKSWIKERELRAYWRGRYEAHLDAEYTKAFFAKREKEAKG